jgi:hypothetical protein
VTARAEKREREVEYKNVPPVKIVLQPEMTHGEKVELLAAGRARRRAARADWQYTLQAQLGEMKNTFHIVHFCLTKESAEVAARQKEHSQDEVFLRERHARGGGGDAHNAQRQKCNSYIKAPLLFLSVQLL